MRTQLRRLTVYEFPYAGWCEETKKNTPSFPRSWKGQKDFEVKVRVAKFPACFMICFMNRVLYLGFQLLRLSFLYVGCDLKSSSQQYLSIDVFTHNINWLLYIPTPASYIIPKSTR